MNHDVILHSVTGLHFVELLMVMNHASEAATDRELP